MITNTRPLNNAALYTGVNTSAGPITRTPSPTTSFPRQSGQRVPNTASSIRLVGKANRRIAAPRTRGAALTP